MGQIIERAQLAGGSSLSESQRRWTCLINRKDPIREPDLARHKLAASHGFRLVRRMETTCDAESGTAFVASYGRVSVGLFPFFLTPTRYSIKSR